MSTLVYIAMGSNIAPKATYLDQAVQLLQSRFPNQFSQSSWYLCNPYRNLDQGAYLNGACCFATDLPASNVLEQVLSIERQSGRVRTEKKWDNRTLDLDIALYGREIITEPNLQVPHYDLLHRDFFLVPLLEINPDLTYPGTTQKLSWYLDQIPKQNRTSLQKYSVDS